MRRQRADDAQERRRLQEWATERRTFGYDQLRVLLAWEGYQLNQVRTKRLDRAAGLAVPGCVNDALATGRWLRLLVILGVVTRAALSTEGNSALTCARVESAWDRWWIANR